MKIYTTEHKGIKYLCNESKGTATPLNGSSAIELEVLLKQMSKISNSNNIFKTDWFELEDLSILQDIDIIFSSDVSYTIEDNQISEFIIIGKDSEGTICIFKQNNNTEKLSFKSGLNNSLLFYADLMSVKEELLEILGFSNDGSMCWFLNDIVVDLAATYLYFNKLDTELKPKPNSKSSLKDIIALKKVKDTGILDIVVD